MEQPTNPRAILGNRFPFFSRPKPIGFYSIDSEGKCTNDFSQLRYLNRIPSDDVHFDLNHNIFRDFTIRGFNEDTDVKNDADTDKINKIVADVDKDANNEESQTEKLIYIRNHLKDHRETFDLFDESDIPLKIVPFLCHRGFLSNVSALPYNNLQPFRFSACLFRGVLYLYDLVTLEDVTRNENLSWKDVAMELWGYKFEQYLVSDDLHGDPDIESQLCDVRQFSVVLESRLNEHRLIYSAEKDGILTEKSSLTEKLQSNSHSRDDILQKLGKCKFVELKTSKLIEKRKQEITFRRHKTRSWWLQCYFSGIETLVCGFRDDDGVVHKVEQYKVSDLPKMNDGYWHPNICMNFCDELLKYVKDCFTRKIGEVMPGWSVDNVRNLPMMELVFERLPGCNVKLSTAAPHDTPILSEWFINMFPKDS